MRVAFYTLGCKVNQYETEVLSARFAAEGFDVVPGHAPGCDVYVVGSCTVTAEGDRKTRQAVRRFRRENPGAIVVLTGCYPQAFPREAAAVTEADIVTGALGRAALPQLVKDFSLDHQRVVNIPKHEKGEDFESCSAADFGVRTRAFLKIQEGCDNWCSYCIIPAARGPVRSKPMPELQSELLTLARNGYREIVLTGINLSNYGREWGLHLSDAVLAAAATPGVERVRLGSIEPDLLTPQEIYRLAEGCGGKLCPQFHLSLQSGCDATLRRMNRHYDTTQYRAVAEAVRKSFPGAALTTDMMVGFAGETEVDHQESLQFAREIGFAKIHAFAYSQRPGTRAAQMDDPVPYEEKTRWLGELLPRPIKSAAARNSSLWPPSCEKPPSPPCWGKPSWYCSKAAGSRAAPATPPITPPSPSATPPPTPATSARCCSPPSPPMPTAAREFSPTDFRRLSRKILFRISCSLAGAADQPTNS